MKKYILWAASLIALICLDQLTKFVALTNLRGTEGVPIIKNVFKLFYLENHGAAFGILQNQRIALLGVTVAVLCVLIFIFVKIPDTKRYMPMQFLLVLIAAGAVGNMIDRIMNGYVVDFLYFELINFPVFNIADCYVVVAAVMAMLLIMFYYKEDDFDIIKNK